VAAIPGVLLIGDFSIQGGAPGLRAVLENIAEPQTRLGYLGDRTVMRIVPDNPANGEPTNAFRPWYDWAASDTIYTVGSSTATTITVSSSPGWTVDQFAGRLITVVNSFFLGYERRMPCLSNTADTLTFAAGTVPTVGNIFFIGEGRMRDYHAAAGWLTNGELLSPTFSKRGGSSAQTNGQGVGPDATLVRALVERVYTGPDKCYVVKWGNVGPVSTAWADSPNDSARANLLAEKVRIDAAAAADGGNTIAWDVAVIDQTIVELGAWPFDPFVLPLAYPTRLQQMIAWLRSPAMCNNPNLLVVLVNHRSDLLSASVPGGAPFIRQHHVAVSRADANVVLIDMEGAKPGVAGDFANAQVIYYAQQEYFRLGEMIAERIRLHKLGVAPAFSNGIPTYLMLGDSIAVGEIASAWTTNAASVELSGPNFPSLVRENNQIIWVRGDDNGQVYHPHTNSNPSGSVNGAPFAGPDLSIMAELGKRHPDGFLLVKRASYSSTLAASGLAYNPTSGNGGRWIKGANEHYAEMVHDFTRATQWVNEVLGKQIDLRGAYVLLGHNDQAVAGGGTMFADAIENFCLDLWGDFGTRTDGDMFPIVWRVPMANVVGANAVEMPIVRAAITELAASQARLRAVNVDGLEVDRDDGLHETPETAVETGRRMTAALIELDETSLCNATPFPGQPGGVAPAPTSTLDGLTEDDTIASYSTPELSVTRRSVSDQIKLERHRASKGMPRRTRVRFDR